MSTRLPTHPPTTVTPPLPQPPQRRRRLSPAARRFAKLGHFAWLSLACAAVEALVREGKPETGRETVTGREN